MGTVYRAIDRLTGQRVALKRVDASREQELPEGYDENDFRLALAAEFKLLASMRHPNIIEVLDYGFDDAQQPYYTMQLLEGAQTILEATADQPIDYRVNLIAQVLQALAYLHRRGVLHRDLKPGNVMVMNDEIKLLDFGLSVMRERTGSDTDSEASAGDLPAGTLAYMAPELLMGQAATVHSDLYSAGMIAYEVLSGAHPFDREDISKLVNQILYRVPDVTELEIDSDLSGWARRMLLKEPAERFESVRDALVELDAVTDQSIPVETTAGREGYLQAARFVGRDREIDILTQSLGEVRAGTGKAWLIAGESGVGKSRLVDEMRTRALVDGALVIRGQAISEGRSSYQIWRPVLRWLALLTPLDPLEAGLIKRLVPDVVTLPEYDLNAAAELNPGQVQAHILEMLQGVLRDYDQPVVIILEDLHWASGESLELVAQLAERVASLPLLLIASFRDDDSPDLPSELPGIPVLKLERLDKASIRELSEAMLGSAGRKPQVINLLQRETEGNVFFLVEVVRALAEEAGQLGQVGYRTLPQSVFAGGVARIIQRRLDRIREAYHRPLQIAAVIGRELDLRLMRELIPDLDLYGWLMECANAAVLEVKEGVWHFAHDKLLEGVLARVSDNALREIHRDVAQAMEAIYSESEWATRLAYHWRMTGDAKKEDYYVCLAGEQALRTGAYQEAVTFFDRALHLVSPVVMDAMVSQMRRVYLQHRQAEGYLGYGAYAEAETLYLNTLDICEDMGDQTGMMRSLYALGHINYMTGQYVKAREYFQRSLRIYRDFDDKHGIVKTLNSLGDIAYQLGDRAFAKLLYQQSLTISREIGDQWGVAGKSAVGAGDNNRAERLEEQQELLEDLEDLTRLGDRPGMARTLSQLGSIAYHLGHFKEAQQRFRKSLAICQEIPEAEALAIDIFNWMGLVSMAMNDIGGARKYLRKGLAAAQHSDDKIALMRVIINLARFHVSQNNKDVALELLAFVLNSSMRSTEIEDEVEQILVELEAELPPDRVKQAWERGKGRNLESLLNGVLLD